MLAATLVATLGIVLSVTYRMYDPDIWQHLTVGKAIWQLRSVPHTQLWSWPTYGAPDVNPWWGFCALLWPFWKIGGVWGIFAWRWLTTLAAFGLLWAAARRMGARGLAPLAVLVLCSLVYRQRSMVRPETLAAVLFAVEIWILETRRHGGPDRSPWLVAVAWVWANVHLSYYLLFVVLGIHLLEAHFLTWRGRHGGARTGQVPAGAAGAVVAGPARLWLVALAAAAISFVNPFGWRALWQPFDYFLHGRSEPIFQTIGELAPVVWSVNVRNGLPLLLLAWPALALWRAWRRGPDRVELATGALFIALALPSQRFLGPLALAAAPYLGRDLDEWVRSRYWPRWTARPLARGALAAAACIAVGLPEWTREEVRAGVGFDLTYTPVQACDFIARQGIRGRGFNRFWYGGYMLWRFWPERDRLPFMDIHQAGTREDRDLSAYAGSNREAWLELDRRHRFDYLLLNHVQMENDHLLDFLDADSTWALVFLDDAAAVFARRAGRFAALAASLGYRVLPAGKEGIDRLGQGCGRDTVLRARARAELERAAASSPTASFAWSLLANVALLDARWEEARSDLRRALAVDPGLPMGHMRLGIIALMKGDPRGALAEYARERSEPARRGGLVFRRGQAWRQLGEIAKARAAYERELQLNPGNVEARDSLEALVRPR